MGWGMTIGRGFCWDLCGLPGLRSFAEAQDDNVRDSCQRQAGMSEGRSVSSGQGSDPWQGPCPEPFGFAQDRLRRMDQDDNGGRVRNDNRVEAEPWECVFAQCLESG